MGKLSTIEWTDHTFNPWWGCVKVSPACKHCYAEAWAKRLGQKVWGGDAPRRFFGDKHWREPLSWNEEAKISGIRKRVFCASMADVFEPRADLNSERKKLWALIEITPHLDWLLLTKRPGSIGKLVPWGKSWPDNVWIGTTVESQTWAKKRIPLLLKYPAKCRFLSCEPLLDHVDLSQWLFNRDSAENSIDWIIAGGESGPNSRPMLPSWARSLRDQCRKTKTAFHFKQWGHWAPEQNQFEVKGKKRFWDGIEGKLVGMNPVGKKEAGRFLDGETWDELPSAA